MQYYASYIMAVAGIEHTVQDYKIDVLSTRPNLCATE